MATKDPFSGPSRPIESKREKERGPDCFRTMKTGQTSQLFFLGWLEGGKYGRQPIFFSQLIASAFALPAHTILIDKLEEIAEYTPLIVACDRAPDHTEKGTNKAARYSVQAFAVVKDASLLETLRDAKSDFDERVAALRSGRAPAAQSQSAEDSDDLPF